ncbi:MAG TPA: glycosyltransferase family 2 protein, partial [Longimicrobiales bacterium]|nr:glycosyltransferase family 2 protein [Longimicrobiales bacterium]
MHPLAIVIPAYKPEFLGPALASVAAQTDRRFTLYVGDDAGPPEIARLCATYSGGPVRLVYLRWEHNLGRRSLAAHWNRCVRACAEPWVWLFSDDDLMAPDCVAAFYEELARGPATDLLRFDTDVIDARGRRLVTSPPHPAHESGVDFVYDRLQGRRNSFVVEYVFRRGVFEREGGFPELPVAW